MSERSYHGAISRSVSEMRILFFFFFFFFDVAKKRRGIVVPSAVQVAEQGVMPPGAKYIWAPLSYRYSRNSFASEIAAPVKVPLSPPLPCLCPVPTGYAVPCRDQVTLQGH